MALSTFNVTTTLDGVAGSLRQAVIAANAHPGADTINLPAGTYALTLAGAGEDFAATGDLDIRDALTISGARDGNTIIDGAGLDRVFQVFGAKVDISYVNIQGGMAERGGGIFMDGGTVSLSHCTLAFNQAIGAVGVAGGPGGDAQGGSIYQAGGSLTVTHCGVAANGASGGVGIVPGSGFGGGIYQASGDLTITNSQISDNFADGTTGAGGGIYQAAGDLNLVQSRLESNLAGPYVGLGFGGGIYHADGTLTVIGSLLLFNRAGAAQGGPTGFGGGIYQSGGTLVLIHTEVTANEADWGGAGGGLYIAGGSTCLTKTIVYGNFADSDPDIFGPFTIC
jgi:hypothetical protein